MNRTTLFLASAGLLALIALVVGLPQTNGPAAPHPLPLPSPAPVTSQDGSITMSARISHPYVGIGPQEVFVTADLKGVDIPGATRSPVNLALVIDRSGSMSGNKLANAKNAARQLISQLTATDRLAIVDYGSDVRNSASVPCTESNKTQLLAYVDNVWDEGGTNIGAGLQAGQRLLQASMSDFKVNRLLLITDGNPTEGIVDANSLVELTRQIRSSGVSITAVGVGSDFNEDLMQDIAVAGAGAYAYLDRTEQLASIFQKDLSQAGTQVARNVALSFEIPPETTFSEVFGYRIVANDGKRITISLPDFAAGQNERVVARVLVHGLTAGKRLDVSSLKLEYTDLLQSKAITSLAQVSSLTTDQPDLVLSNRDKEAAVYAARALSAANTQAAAEALQRGNRSRALELLKNNLNIFKDVSGFAGAKAVADDVAEQEALGAEFGRADSAPAVQSAGKTAKRAARIGFGQNSSTY